MTPTEFRTWRDRVGLTQQEVADKLGVSRTTIQNWECAATRVPQAVQISCEIWEERLKQEDSNRGPLTLVYSDGPMFVDPYGPRRRPAMMQQEPYPTNAAALARVQQLWGREDFHNPFVIEESRKPLWNAVELERVVRGDDDGAPTLPNLIRRIAKIVRANSSNFVRTGPKSPTASEMRDHQKAIEAEADELDRIAASSIEGVLRDRTLIETIFHRLLALGTQAPDLLVHNVAQAFVVFEREQKPVRSEAQLRQEGYVIDYKGYEITYPAIRMFGNMWTVNLCSNNPHLLNKLGGRNIVINDYKSLESAIAEAKRYVDDLS
jgi:Helix-turn-helix domain